MCTSATKRVAQPRQQPAASYSTARGSCPCAVPSSRLASRSPPQRGVAAAVPAWALLMLPVGAGAGPVSGRIKRRQKRDEKEPPSRPWVGIAWPVIWLRLALLAAGGWAA